MKEKYPPVTATTFEEDFENYGIEIAKERSLWRQFDQFKANNPTCTCYMVKC